MPRRYFGPGPSSELMLSIVSPLFSSGAPLVIVCHGVGTGPADYVANTASRDLDRLSDLGYAVLVPDLGGSNTWGTDTVVHATTGRIQAARTWAQTNLGCDITKTVLIGDSMGGMNALGYMWRAPSNVTACVLRCPVVAADALHDRNGGLGALMDAAYGSTANWEADKANRDPSDSSHTTQIAAVKSKVRIWYSTDDPTVLPADITSYTAATGVKAVPFGAVNHAPFGTHVHGAAQAMWIKSLVG